MSPKEQAIADAALRPYAASDYEAVFQQIAEYTGFSVEDVEHVIHDFTADKTLIDKCVPNIEPTPAGTEIVKVCYEKGSMWGNPHRITLVE